MRNEAQTLRMWSPSFETVKLIWFGEDIHLNPHIKAFDI